MAIDQVRADPGRIQQGVFIEKAGRGFDHMSKVGYCYDCEWSCLPEDVSEKVDTLASANASVSSQAQGHAYFNRGHTINTVYVPFSIHPNPYGDDSDV